MTSTESRIIKIVSRDAIIMIETLCMVHFKESVLCISAVVGEYICHLVIKTKKPRISEKNKSATCNQHNITYAEAEQRIYIK